MAGQGSLTAPYDSHVPDSVEVRQRRIGDPEAIDLFQRCGLLVLPYLDASQSALIAAAYYFQKPVIVTDTGALAEYVEPGRTGWIVRPGDQPALAAALDEGLSDLVRLKRMGVQARSWYEAQRISEWDALTAMYRQVAGRDQGIGK